MEDPLDGSQRDVRLQWPAHAHGSELSQLSRDMVELNLYRLMLTDKMKCTASFVSCFL